MNKTLEQLKKELEQIAGEWDGKEPGLLEERADIANEALGLIESLEENLEELKIK